MEEKSRENRDCIKIDIYEQQCLSRLDLPLAAALHRAAECEERKDRFITIECKGLNCVSIA